MDLKHLPQEALINIIIFASRQVVAAQNALELVTKELSDELAKARAERNIADRCRIQGEQEVRASRQITAAKDAEITALKTQVACLTKEVDLLGGLLNRNGRSVSYDHGREARLPVH